jgi:uncharacterized LabA/DUF88 family protein
MYSYAILVDAGYLLAGGGEATLGTADRNELKVDYAGLIGLIVEQAGQRFPDGELLRVYWYDASPQRVPNAEHILVAEQPDTKLRLGSLTPRGQKGVDALILSDMTGLARCGQVRHFVLVAGDGDHVEAVEQTQMLGARVELWWIETSETGASPELRRAADRQQLLPKQQLEGFFARVAPSPVVHPAGRNGHADRGRPAARPATRRPPGVIDPAEAHASGGRFAAQWLALATPSQVAEVTTTERPFVPQSVDSQLLRYALDEQDLAPGTELDYGSRLALRAGFWAGFDSRHGTPGGEEQPPASRT